MISIVTPPALEPITLEQARIWVKADDEPIEDELIETLISAAREKAEHYTGRKFINTVIDETFGIDEDIQLSFLHNVSSVAVSVDGDTLTIDEDYTIGASDMGHVTIGLLERPSTFPVVRYTVGYGTTANDVPKVVKLALQLMVGHFYATRMDPVKMLPTSSENLLNTVRSWET